MNFFHIQSKYIFCGGGGWGCGGVARGGGRAVGGGVDGWTDIQTQTDLPLLGAGVVGFVIGWEGLD